MIREDELKIHNSLVLMNILKVVRIFSRLKKETL